MINLTTNDWIFMKNFLSSASELTLFDPYLVLKRNIWMSEFDYRIRTISINKSSIEDILSILSSYSNIFAHINALHFKTYEIDSIEDKNIEISKIDTF